MREEPLPATDEWTKIPHTDVARSVAELITRGLTLGCAESLTGGALTSTFVSVPGVSEVLRGGIVSYATDIKASVLGVSQRRLDETGLSTATSRSRWPVVCVGCVARMLVCRRRALLVPGPSTDILRERCGSQSPALLGSGVGYCICAVIVERFGNRP